MQITTGAQELQHLFLCDMMRAMSILKDRARAVIQQHEGAAKAARALKINRSVLTMLADGKRKSASPKTLRALGLKARREVVVSELQAEG